MNIAAVVTTRPIVLQMTVVKLSSKTNTPKRILQRTAKLIIKMYLKGDLC